MRRWRPTSPGSARGSCSAWRTGGATTSCATHGSTGRRSSAAGARGRGPSAGTTPTWSRCSTTRGACSMEGVRAVLRAPRAAVNDFDRHFRRAVWIAALMTTFGAALVYIDKAADDRSAFIRWRHQVLQFWDGENIYDEMMFPNPPIFPITLYPLMTLPPVAGAVCWFALKAALTAVAIVLCFRMVRPAGPRRLPSR